MSTYYCGDLIKGKYQFAFGGNTCEKSGKFMMPYSGRIKRIKVRILGGIFNCFFGEIDKVDGGRPLILVGSDDLPFEDREKNGLFLTGNLFSIILFKDSLNLNIDSNPIGSYLEEDLPDIISTNPTGSIISTYRCIDTSYIDGIGRTKFKCNFDFVHDLKNHPLSEGDIINIRTERDFQKTKTEFPYLFTFLIELDPL